MAMEVSSIYAGYYNNILNDRKESKQATGVDLNASESSKDKVQAYYEGLCKKFPGISFNTSGGEMHCSHNKVVVNLSYDCLKKMANDPEFAKKIEFNLTGEIAANERVYSMAKRDGVELGGRIVKYDADGERTSSCGGMRTANVSGGSRSSEIVRENVEKRVQKNREKKKEQEKKLEEKRAKRKQEQEALFEKIKEPQEAKKTLQSIGHKGVGIRGVFDKRAGVVSHYAASEMRITEVSNVTGVDFKA